MLKEILHKKPSLRAIAQNIEDLVWVTWDKRRQLSYMAQGELWSHVKFFFFFSTKYKAVWKENQQSLLKSLGTPSVYVHSGTGMSWTGIHKNQQKAKTSKKKFAKTENKAWRGT